MILSTEIYSLRRIFGDENTIGMFADIGFEALDYSMYAYDPASPVFGEDYAAYAKKLRTLAAQNGIFFNQAHAPYDYSGDEAELPAHIEHVKRAIAFAGLLGAQAVVVHPIRYQEGSARREYNRAYYQALAPTARAYGIRVAIENLFTRNTETGLFEESACGNARELADFIDSFGPEQFAACLDIGHCLLAGGDPAQAVYTLGPDRLKALHIHDNDLSNDQHMMPYLGTADWPAVMRALRAIGYGGALTFETHRNLERLPDALVPDALRLVERMGRFLAGMM
jgi:sugar phosphate isomerase/epimerase